MLPTIDLVRKQVKTGLRATAEGLNECCLVFLPMEFFQNKHSKERVRLIHC